MKLDGKLTAWKIALIVIFLLSVTAAYKYAAYVYRWRCAVACHHADVQHGLRLGKEVEKRVSLAWKSRLPLVDFEKEFGSVTPLAPAVDRKKVYPDADDNNTHMFRHDDSFRVFYLTFHEGVLTGYNSHFGVDNIQDNLPTIEARMSKIR